MHKPAKHPDVAEAERWTETLMNLCLSGHSGWHGAPNELTSDADFERTAAIVRLIWDQARCWRSN